MASERDFEDVLVRYPEMIEEGLRLIGRQVDVCGRRIDLLFEDRFKQKLVVELKWGPIKDEHVGQIMYYQGALLSGREPVRTMLVGNRVPPAIQKSLDFNGLASKEIRLSTLIEFLRAKGETDLVRPFEADQVIEPVDAAGRPIAMGFDGEIALGGGDFHLKDGRRILLPVIVAGIHQGGVGLR